MTLVNTREQKAFQKCTRPLRRGEGGPLASCHVCEQQLDLIKKSFRGGGERAKVLHFSCRPFFFGRRYLCGRRCEDDSAERRRRGSLRSGHFQRRSMPAVNEDGGGSLAQSRAFPHGPEMLSQLLPRAHQVDTGLHLFFFLFPLLCFSVFLLRQHSTRRHAIPYVRLRRGLFRTGTHARGYKCAREAPSRVHEGGLQGDITRRRKARVSLPRSADAALALMFPTSDAKTNKTLYTELQ